MYERLTKWEVEGCASVKGCSPIDKDTANAINRLCDLEDKIEQGKIVELPCKVGDKVYRIWSVGKHGKSTAEFVVTNVSQIMENTWVIRYQKQAKSLYSTPTIYQCNFTDIGKTVFLTREEAEQALKGAGE